MSQSFAYETTSEERNPSPHKGDVWKWIVWPAIFSFFSALAWGIGVGLMLTAWKIDKASFFIWGCGFFSAGFVGLATIVFKSWSFDKTDVTRSKTTTPVFYTPEASKPDTGISGNHPVTAAKSPVTVRHDNQEYTFTVSQLNKAEERIPNDNYVVARDHLLIETNAKFTVAKFVMIGKGYWEVTGKRGGSDIVEWTQDGIDWHYDQMRKRSPHNQA